MTREVDPFCDAQRARECPEVGSTRPFAENAPSWCDGRGGIVSKRVIATGQALRSEVVRGAPLHTYQDLVIGTRSWSSLLQYEVLGAWGALIPGAAGILFRKILWRRMFGKAGRGSVWGRNVVVRHPAKMWFGNGVVVDDDCYLDAKGCDPGEFQVAEGALISRGSILSAKTGSLQIGERVNIGAQCVLYSCGGLEIGPDTMLAAQCYLGGGIYDARGSTSVPLRQQLLPGKGVVIEEDCWLGAGVIVIDGVRIGRGSVIAAGAVVTRDVAPLSIAAGIPARPIGSRETNPAPRGS